MADLTGMLQASAGVGGGGATGSYIAASAGGSALYLFDHTTPGSLSIATTYGSSSANRAVCDWSPDGSYLVWGRSTSPEITLLSHSVGSLTLSTTYAIGTEVLDVSFSPDGNYIACARNGGLVTLLNHTSPGSLSLAATYTIAAGGVGVLGSKFSPDGNYIAFGYTSPTLVLLDHTTPGSLSLATTYALAGAGKDAEFSPDGDYLACIHNTSIFFTLLNHSAGTLSLAATYSLNSSTAFAIGACSFSSDGNYIATGITNSGGGVMTLLDHTTPGSVSLAATYTIAGNTPEDVNFSPDGAYIVIGGRDSPRVTLLNHSAGSVSLATTNTSISNTVQGVAFSPN